MARSTDMNGRSVSVVLAPCAAILAASLAACGDNVTEDPEELLAKLGTLDGVTVEEHPTETAPYTYYVLRFTQPVDHARPDGATFEQRVSLLHRDLDAPMIALTSGYWDYFGDSP
jgi:hypothetical protein